MIVLHRPLAHTVAVVALVALAGCGKSDRSTTDSAGGNVAAERAQVADTGRPLSVTPTAGVAPITASDGKSVTKATEYRLTDDNFRRFIQATDSLTALRARDPQARAFLDQQITDAGVGTQVSDTDAGWKHLESNPAVNNAITSAGISVRDYFVASIAIAQAERFMGNPKAAPPTPALAPNAEFLDAHKAELSALRSRSGGTSSTR
jgi:major membrane immunogen (membrane-anchored lipoprotein)